MLALFFIAAALLLVSGAVKVRAAARVGLGVPVLALAEVLAGVGLFGIALAVDFTGGQGLAILVGAVALILVSSLQVGAQVRRRQRLRAASEGARLATYVNFRPSAGAGGETEPVGRHATKARLPQARDVMADVALRPDVADSEVVRQREKL